MTDREKLAKTLEDAEYQKHYPSTLASVLLANGVVVREKGEWRYCGSDRWNDAHACSECGKIAMDDSDFCPNCGADMRKGENDGA